MQQKQVVFFYPSKIEKCCKTREEQPPVFAIA
jgi:hypothetical protein